MAARACAGAARANKPFCDATHGLKGWRGPESADHSDIAERRDGYTAGELIVYDDRSRCAHFGQCTSTLPAVFRQAEEPFVDPAGATAAEIAATVANCPSGALAYAQGAEEAPTETTQPPSITPIADASRRARRATSR